eukprot:jgi/Botrbrau1/1430/Bobra.0063s0122.1
MEVYSLARSDLSLLSRWTGYCIALAVTLARTVRCACSVQGVSAVCFNVVWGLYSHLSGVCVA